MKNLIISALSALCLFNLNIWEVKPDILFFALFAVCALVVFSTDFKIQERREK